MLAKRAPGLSYERARRDTHPCMSTAAPSDYARETSRPVQDDIRGVLMTHHANAWTWATACCRGDRQAAHDVLHDVYVGILSGRTLFAGRSSFKTWLFGCIRVTAMARRRRRLVLDFLFEPIGPLAEKIAAPLVAESASRTLLAAVAALPQRQSEVVTLVFGHDLTIEEAAAIMNLSVGAARQHHARAKEKLRAVLNPDRENSHG